MSPVGTTEFRGVQSSLRDSVAEMSVPRYPAVNCWAIIKRPYGTDKSAPGPRNC